MASAEYTSDVQISLAQLQKSNPESLEVFGDWKTNLSHLHDVFVSNSQNPFSHVVIENFLAPAIAEMVASVFPSPEQSIWHVYHNPLEKKLSCNTLSILPTEIVQILHAANTPDFVNIVRQISGIPDLEADPYLHGGGIHSHTRGGKLDVHLDYSIHPRLEGKERRLNLILYLNKGWTSAFGGEIQFWNKELTECVTKVLPTFNRAVLFQTSDLSYHGLPDPVACPKGICRNSIATYYLSPVRQSATLRLKAQYFPRPFEPPSSLLDKLRQIRPHRRITETDLPANWESINLAGNFPQSNTNQF